MIQQLISNLPVTHLICGVTSNEKNDCEKQLNFYFYIDYKAYLSETDMKNYGRFHARWRGNPTSGAADPEAMCEAWTTPNLTHENKDGIFDAEGVGDYVGCHVDIDVFTRHAHKPFLSFLPLAQRLPRL